MNIKNLSELIYLSNAGNEISVLQIGLLGSDTLVEIFYRVVPQDIFSICKGQAVMSILDIISGIVKI